MGKMCKNHTSLAGHLFSAVIQKLTEESISLFIFLAGVPG